MNIDINTGSGDPYFQAAENIVEAFELENRQIFSQDEKEEHINSIALTIFNASNSLEESKSHISIDLNAFPEAMKSWASTRSWTKNKSLDTNQEKSKVAFSHLGQTSDDGFEIDQTISSNYSFFNQDWRDVTLVRMAKVGQRGAWFFVNPLRGSVVVKNQSGPEKQLIGTIFLRGMGLNAPDCKLVDSRSEEGMQLSRLGQSAGICTENPSQYIVMDRVKGSNFDDLARTQENFMLIENNLIEIGKLAVYDLLIGNFDRFQLDSAGFNPGNIMFENKQLIPIDTDCLFQDEENREDFTRLAFKKIIEDRSDLDNKIALKLEKNFFGDYGTEELFSREKIKEGMHLGILNLIQISSNIDDFKETIINSCSERGLELDSDYFPPYPLRLLSYIHSLAPRTST